MIEQLPMFDAETTVAAYSAPPTEGIKYAGSKLRLLPAILALAHKTDAATVFDGFAGTTRVSQAFAKRGYTVICNDIAVWSKVFGTCYLMSRQPREAYRDLIAHLNALPPTDGWFTEHYGGDPNGGCSVQRDGLKRPWQRKNTRKLDAVRREIEHLRLSEVEKAVALTSLILALDRVDNTLGHYASYLNTWSPRSYNDLYLTVPDLTEYRTAHQVRCEDIFQAIGDVAVDLAYYDPPYGSNNAKMPPSRVRYASYYHLWTTVCLDDKPPLFGRVKRRLDTSDTLAASIFEEFRKDADGRFVAVRAIEQLLAMTKARWIILSYSSGGRATADELNSVIRRNGHLREVVEIDHKRNVMAEMRWTNEWLRDAQEPNREFLFLIER